MKKKRDDIADMNVEINNWKSQSKEYLKELDSYIYKVKNIKDEGLKRDVLMNMLRCDNELTLLAEKLFCEQYAKGYADGKKEKI